MILQFLLAIVMSFVLRLLNLLSFLVDAVILKTMIHIALFEPEIAINVGSIARTSLANNSKLHLIRPFAFRLNDKALKRSAMDYWNEVDLQVHASFNDFFKGFEKEFETKRVFSLTTKANRFHSEASFNDGDVFLFGPESRGLPLEIRQMTEELKIPMHKKARSLNLAVSVGVLSFEVARQLNYLNLS